MDINKSLAILESEMFCRNLHKSTDVLSALKRVNSYSVDELYEISKFKADEIDRIVNYWRGL